MKTYIYPENLRANVKLWFWSVRDFIIICTGLIFIPSTIQVRLTKKAYILAVTSLELTFLLTLIREPRTKPIRTF